ncbi:MAG: M48 family metalloprotease, partial [Verrucomicrobiota bacterium]
AIASGSPVPDVYVMDREPGINAFAAGFTSSDAIIAVTSGTIHNLNRDELQGVIAHEFSHILNGDMRLNLRLTGVLHGILLIGLIGYFLFRTIAFTGGRRSRRDGRVTLFMAVLGLTLMAIGFVGVFFGKLIKSAVSRQREYLADASSVQYTRNPDGIAGALKKIGGYNNGSRITSSHAEEASHFFFANGLPSSFLGMLATHPPLEERIRRLDASFQGEYVETKGAVSPVPGAAGFAGGQPPLQGGQRALSSEQVLESVGSPLPEHIAYASRLLQDLPDFLREAAGDPFGARGVIYSLLIDSNKRIREKQLSCLREKADKAAVDQTYRMLDSVADIEPRFILPLVDISVSTLGDLSDRQFDQFEANIDQLIEADDEIDLFEFTLKRIVKRHLAPKFRKVSQRAAKFYSMRPVMNDIVCLVSCIAHWGTDSREDAEKAFVKGIKVLGLEKSFSIAEARLCGLQALDRALSRLVFAVPPVRKKILEACVACISADGYVTTEEAELLRAVADSLDCPVPPLFAGRTEQ